MGTFDLVLDVIHSRRTTYRRRTKNTRHDLLKRDHQACSTHQWVPPYSKYKLVNYSIILRSRLIFVIHFPTDLVPLFLVNNSFERDSGS